MPDAACLPGMGDMLTLHGGHARGPALLPVLRPPGYVDSIALRQVPAKSAVVGQIAFRHGLPAAAEQTGSSPQI